MCENTSPIYSVGGNTVKLMHIMLSTAKNTASKQKKTTTTTTNALLYMKGFFFMRDSIIKKLKLKSLQRQ